VGNRHGRLLDRVRGHRTPERLGPAPMALAVRPAGADVAGRGARPASDPGAAVRGRSPVRLLGRVLTPRANPCAGTPIGRASVVDALPIKPSVTAEGEANGRRARGGH